MSRDDLTACDLGFGPDEQFERLVQNCLLSDRARREARRLLAAEDRPTSALPPIETLRDRLARPRRDVAWRIDRWQPHGTRVLLAAQFKAGKTTLLANVLRSLADGDPFLGEDAVAPLAGPAVLLDFEMSEGMLDDWLREQRIRHDDRLVVLPMRGREGAFNLLDAENRRAWARLLQQAGATYLLIDCLRPILDALGLDEHHDGGRFLVHLDMLLTEAGIPDALLVHHMGHTGERSRGDSRFRDWPDVEWQLVRDGDDPASRRFIKAYGRDVDVPESQLAFTLDGRRLTLLGGSRRDSKAEAALLDVVTLLGATDKPLSGRAIKTALKDSDHSRDLIDAALKLGRESHRLAYTTGDRSSILYTLPGPVSERPAPIKVPGHTDTHGNRPPDTGRTLPDTRTVNDARRQNKGVSISGPRKADPDTAVRETYPSRQQPASVRRTLIRRPSATPSRAPWFFATASSCRTPPSPSRGGSRPSAVNWRPTATA